MWVTVDSVVRVLAALLVTGVKIARRNAAVSTDLGATPSLGTVTAPLATKAPPVSSLVGPGSGVRPAVTPVIAYQVWPVTT